MSRRLSDSAERQFKKTLSLMQKGKLVEALEELEKAEEAAKLLLKDPESEFIQTNLQMNFINVFSLGYFLQRAGRLSQAQNFYELSLLISQKLLQNDPENVAYQSYVGTTLNNLGALLKNMGRLEDAKNRFKGALKIYTEPMQYLTIGRKSDSIIRLIELNLKAAEKEENSFTRLNYLEEAFHLCKESQDFFINMI